MNKKAQGFLGYSDLDDLADLKQPNLVESAEGGRVREGEGEGKKSDDGLPFSRISGYKSERGLCEIGVVWCVVICVVCIFFFSFFFFIFVQKNRNLESSKRRKTGYSHAQWENPSKLSLNLYPLVLFYFISLRFHSFLEFNFLLFHLVSSSQKLNQTQTNVYLFLKSLFLNSLLLSTSLPFMFVPPFPFSSLIN